MPAAAFAGYEHTHQQRTSTAVGPLFVFAGAAAITAFVVRPNVASGIAAGCVVSIVLLTALGAVPQHRRLAVAFDARTHARLLRIDSGRLVLAVGACAAAVAYALGS